MTKRMILNNLNPKQKDAVIYTKGPLLVLAGAGSGKTKVLSRRFVYLTSSLKVDPASILMMTFTKRAADEMKSLIQEMNGDISEDLWIGTFHSMAARILRKDIKKIGYSNDFCIYDESDAGTLVRSILKELKIHEALYRGILSKISSLKASMIGPEEFLANEDSYGFDEKFARVYVKYHEELKKNNALDYDDLIMYTVKLFNEYPKVLKKYQKDFEHVLIDEFQDTNLSQYELAKLIAKKHRNICAVGDDDQSIYKFRGAEIGNIRNFKKDFTKSKVIKLEQNYRSTQNILNIADNLIAGSQERMPKKLWTDRDKGTRIHYCTATNEKEEARYIAQSIKEMYLKGKYKYRDIAVLYRVNQQAKAIEDAMRENGQPFNLHGGACFYQQKEVKDIISYLKVIVNPDDSVSLKRIINCPPRQFGATTITRVENEAGKRDESLYKTMKHIAKSGSYPNSLKDKVSGFVKTVDALIAKRNKPLGEVLDLVFTKTGYLDWVGEEKSDQLREFADSLDCNCTVDFLDSASLFSSMDEVNGDNAVSIMTMHNAKGLEFPVVFIAGVEDGIIPHFHAVKDAEELDEERRLLYVGITRAQDMLYMTGAKKRKLYTSVQDQQPSRFLADIPKECYRSIEKRPRADAVASTSLKMPVDLVNSSPFATGARVKHPKWGVGVVRDSYGETDDVKVTVNFPSVGMKRLSLKFANLEKI